VGGARGKDTFAGPVSLLVFRRRDGGDILSAGCGAVPGRNTTALQASKRPRQY